MDCPIVVSAPAFFASVVLHHLDLRVEIRAGYHYYPHADTV